VGGGWKDWVIFRVLTGSDVTGLERNINGFMNSTEAR